MGTWPSCPFLPVPFRAGLLRKYSASFFGCLIFLHPPYLALRFFNWSRSDLEFFSSTTRMVSAGSCLGLYIEVLREIGVEVFLTPPCSALRDCLNIAPFILPTILPPFKRTLPARSYSLPDMVPRNPPSRFLSRFSGLSKRALRPSPVAPSFPNRTCSRVYFSILLPLTGSLFFPVFGDCDDPLRKGPPSVFFRVQFCRPAGLDIVCESAFEIESPVHTARMAMAIDI